MLLKISMKKVNFSFFFLLFVTYFECVICVNTVSLSLTMKVDSGFVLNPSYMMLVIPSQFVVRMKLISTQLPINSEKT